MSPFNPQMNLSTVREKQNGFSGNDHLRCCSVAVVLAKRMRDRREMERYSITPEALHALLASDQEVLVIDARLPLDLLGDSVIIPGALRLAPQEVQENPSLLPKEKDLVVYCTCASDETSRTVLHRALAMGFLRIKFLKGGLQGWRAKRLPGRAVHKTLPSRLG